jgi:hypothetical protein
MKLSHFRYNSKDGENFFVNTFDRKHSETMLEVENKYVGALKITIFSLWYS